MTIILGTLAFKPKATISLPMEHDPNLSGGKGRGKMEEEEEEEEAE